MTTTTVLHGGVLGHRCTCDHPDLWHAEQGRCGDAGCRCRAVAAPGGPSMVHPLYDNTTGERIDYIVPPGDVVCGSRSCGCDTCRAVYAQLTEGQRT